MQLKAGFFGLLGLLFIGLKLGGLIDWSWIWVLSPLWGPLVCATLVAGIFMVTVVICVLLDPPKMTFQK